VEEYSYASAVGRFVYYFINAQTEEYEALLQSLSGVNLGRLKSMHTKMKRDSDSPARIQEVLMSNSVVMKLLTQDFRDRTSEAGQQSPELTESIVSQIARKNSPSEQYILQAILLFNASVLRTNFFKQDKEALCFRLCPQFMSQSGDWPAIPYAVFFVLGSDFQGFHVRFRDISRGGIRLIRSRDKHHYTSNLQTQFAETYGLAFTQNNKNKDIPEFGSKGTILLDPDYVGNGFGPFKKYVSALMDVILPHPEVADNYGKEELLFLGPDEGTKSLTASSQHNGRERP
jgi:glutamate dehydrogenase